MSAAEDWDWSLRIFDHVEVQAADYARSVRFYEEVLAPLGIRKLFEDEESACFANFNVGRGRVPTANLHLCFHARAKEQVYGFMRKNAPSEELADALRRVAKGQRFLDPALLETALEVGANPLTAREAEVLRAASEGGTTAEIGRALFLSPATVRNFSNAISKLDARNRIDAIRIARQSGWI
jgi:DNA-binding CsgD family transcriptional regulator